MIHLTHSGSSGGRPLCNCHRVSHQAMGDSFLPAVYASSSLLQSDELCLACRTVLDGWNDIDTAADMTPITWLDVEEIAPSFAAPTR
ncbi:MAG: hypothetical protein H6823_08180 [Planctomycetaceae bacterium]|nr:hypothetical protein [Planctomycetales bacterium]MCB9938204.1 hypothetical protein [Planctomycetaceae bacterium]